MDALSLVMSVVTTDTLDASNEIVRIDRGS